MKPDVHVKHSNHHSSLTSHKRIPAYGTVRFGISEQEFWSGLISVALQSNIRSDRSTIAVECGPAFGISEQES